MLVNGSEHLSEFCGGDWNLVPNTQLSLGVSQLSVTPVLGMRSSSDIQEYTHMHVHTHIHTHMYAYTQRYTHINNKIFFFIKAHCLNAFYGNNTLSNSILAL